MNKLPQDIINKIQLYLSHPCADMLKAHIEYCDARGKVTWQWAILTCSKKTHVQTKLIAKYDKVMKQLDSRIGYARFADRRVFNNRGIQIFCDGQPMYNYGRFDYRTCLRVIKNHNDDSDSDSSDEEVEVANYVASSSSDSDTPIIAVSRRDPSIRVQVQRLPVANDSDSEGDNERDRLHWEYLSAD